MASPLNLNGGFQATVSNPVASASLRFLSEAPSVIADTNPPVVIYPANLYLNYESPQTVVDSVYTLHASLQFGGKNLAFTGNYTPSTYNPALMMFMMG